MRFPGKLSPQIAACAVNSGVSGRTRQLVAKEKNFITMLEQPVHQLDHLLQVALQAAAAGASEILRFQDVFKVSNKGRNDLVTDADVASQAAIHNILTTEFPDHLFVGEESGAAKHADEAKESDKIAWVVDPIDGTANYVHGLPGFAVSIAAIYRHEPLVGVVYDPLSRDCFTAIRGRGAKLNEKPIKTSGCTAIDHAMIACSFPPNVRRDSLEVIHFLNVLENCQSMRRLGSAALNLCYVGAGRLDGYWATCVNAWDVAAGFLVAMEAGGVIKGVDGEPTSIWNPRFVAAASEPLYRQISELLQS